MKRYKFLLCLTGILISSTTNSVLSKDNNGAVTVRPLPLLEPSEEPKANNFVLEDLKIIVQTKAPLDLLERMDDGSIYKESARIFKSTKLLRKHEGQIAEIVAVVIKQDNGNYALNPEINTAAMSVEYCKFPKISDLTPAACEHLWGKPSKRGDVFQYVLVDSNDAKADYLVEMVFKNNKLSQYRISNGNTNGGAWSEVKNGE